MLDFKSHPLRLALTMILITAGALARESQLPPAPAVEELLVARPQVSSPQTQCRHEVRALYDPNGTGRFYMGREIAQVMGADGRAWLDRPEREDQEQPQVVIKAMGIRGGKVVADLGAGSGYFTFRLAAKVGKTGKVLAVDIQDEMLESLRPRATAMGITNVEEVKGSETYPQLPAGAVDLVLMVDVYHDVQVTACCGGWLSSRRRSIPYPLATGDWARKRKTMGGSSDRCFWRRRLADEQPAR